MRDLFEAIDNWDTKLNILRDHNYLQKVVLVFSSIMVAVWFTLGFDSGVGMIGWGKINYNAYGKTFHFSAFVIYGFLFYGLSKHLEKLGIKQSKNVFYSAFLVLFNVSIFEWFYMMGFAYFQMHRSLGEWFVNEFLFLQQYLWMLILGLLTLLAVYVDSCASKRIYSFQPNAKMFLIIYVCGACTLFWIFYPLPVEVVTLGNWTSSKLFPQTHYWSLYVRNDFLHLVNIVTKAIFAFTQFYIISRFKK